MHTDQAALNSTAEAAEAFYNSALGAYTQGEDTRDRQAGGSSTTWRHDRKPSPVRRKDKRRHRATSMSRRHHGTTAFLRVYATSMRGRLQVQDLAENGIRASAMTNSRRRGINGGCKAAAAPDGSDPLPPDWEIRYPRNGAKDVYYYKSKTDKSTWTRPRLPNCGRSSPTKGGGAQSSGRRSPGIQDNSPKRTGRSQQLRATYRDANSRRLSPLPGQDLSYADRHYIPIEAPASVPTTDSIERRGERDISGSRYVPKTFYGPGRLPSPLPPGGDKRRARSSSPQWDRGETLPRLRPRSV
ncbi:hypothetical protein BD309DRAFT_697717 [Dichomitus squalens]|nr:hypothetical protein BD309DRAFT_697717 [Dichomitus squalens]